MLNQKSKSINQLNMPLVPPIAGIRRRRGFTPVRPCGETHLDSGSPIPLIGPLQQTGCPFREPLQASPPQATTPT